MRNNYPIKKQANTRWLKLFAFLLLPAVMLAMSMSATAQSEVVTTTPAWDGTQTIYICVGGTVTVQIANTHNLNTYRIRKTQPQPAATIQDLTGNGGTITFDPIDIFSATGTYTIAVRDATDDDPDFTFTVNVAADPTAPILTPTPATGLICPGTSVSATFLTAGSGGVGGSADYYEYSVNGGAWQTYTPGNVITDDNTKTSVDIRAFRAHPDGLGCFAENIYSWTYDTKVHNTTLDKFYCTIQEAINDASAGNTIVVSDGTYIGNLEINKQLILKSETQHGAIIQTQSGFNAGNGYGGITFLANGSTLEGFKIEQGVAQAVIHTHNSNNVTIKNNWIIGINSAAPRGIDVGYASANSDGVVIEGNIFNDLYCGVYINRATDLLIDDNDFQTMGDGAVVFDGTWFYNGIDITENTTTSGTKSLMYFFGSQGEVTQSDNTLTTPTVLSNWIIVNLTKNIFYPTLNAAVTAADATNVIELLAGTHALTSSVIVNKALTIQGKGRDNTTLELSSSWFNVNGQYGIKLDAVGITIKDLHFKVVGKGAGDILAIFNSNTEIRNNKFSGQYVFGDGQVTRATVWSANNMTGIVMDNNIIENLRQPGYISNGSGVISNNTFSITRGWVIESAGTLAFTGNTWGTNSSHITILNETYTNIAGLTISNNDFSGTQTDWVIDNRTTTVLDATCNWFGTDDYTAILPKNNGPVVIVPYLLTSNLSGTCGGGPAKPIALSVNHTEASESILVQFTVDDNDLVLNPIPGLDPTTPAGLDAIAALYQNLATALAGGIPANIQAAAMAIGDDVITEYYYYTVEGNPTTKTYLKTANNNDLVKSKYWQEYLVRVSDNARFPNWLTNQTVIDEDESFRTSTNPLTGAVNAGWLNTVLGRNLYVTVTFINNGYVNSITESVAIPAGPVNVYSAEPIGASTFVASYLTIQEAINAGTTQAGYYLVVDAGTYTGHVIVTKNLTLYGAQVGVDARTRSGAESLIQGTFSIDAGLTSVTIDGFKFKANSGANELGIGGPYHSGIYGTVAGSLIIKNNILAGADNLNGPSTNPGLVYVTGNAVTFFQNKVDQIISCGLNTQAAYIVVSAGGTGTIDDNSFAAGLGVGANTGATVSVTDNTITDAYTEGIWFWPSAGSILTITGNTVSDFGACPGEFSALKIVERPASVNTVTNTAAILSALQTGNPGIASFLLQWMGPVHNVTKDLFYTTIQAAIDGASNGNEIMVGAGTYIENASTQSFALGSRQGLKFIGATDLSGNPTTIIQGSLYLNDNDGGKVENIKFVYNTTLSLLSLQNTNGLEIKNCVFEGDNFTTINIVGINHVSGPNGNSAILVEDCNFINGLHVSINSRFGSSPGYGHLFGLHVKNSIFNNVKSGINQQSANDVIVENSTFNLSGNSSYGVRFASATDIANNLSITESVFTVAPGYTTSFAIWLRAAAGGTIVASNNSIGFEVSNESSALLNATCNWWGTADGDLIPAKISGSVTYSPWLVNGTDNDGAAGFQPVPGNCQGTPVVIASAVPTDGICGTPGSILVTFSGGTANYTVDWGTGSQSEVMGSPYTITGLTGGSYTITVTDTYGTTSDPYGPVTVNYLPVYNATASTYHATIQAAIDLATAGDVIELCAGNYTETVNVTKNLTINGPNVGNDPNVDTRVAEAVILDGKINILGANTVVIDGIKIYQTNTTTPVSLGGSTTATIQNTIIERFGSTTGSTVRGIEISNGTGVKNIKNNLFTGDVSGGLFSGHKTWNSGIFMNGPTSVINLADNVFENCRTALNIDDMGSGIALTGNTFQNSGTFISFGGTVATTGSFVLGPNDFKTLVSTFINLSNVTTAFRLDITSSTYNGAAFSSLDLTTLFGIESTMFHRGRSGRNGLVTYVANNQYVIPANPGVQMAVDYAVPGHIINIADGTYNQRVVLNKQVTLDGQSQAGTMLSGTDLQGTGSGITINNGITGVVIKDITVQNYAGAGPNSFAGIYAVGGNNNLTVQNTTLQNNVGGSGFYANGPVTDVLLDYVTASGHTNVAGAARGIVIWNGLKSNITITNCTVFNNNCCGIELQDGDATGVIMQNNNVYNNGDNGIGIVGLTGPGENLIKGNTLTNNGRFGIEIKNPNGTGLETGDGSIVVQNNNVSLTATVGDARDLAGIAVFRRGVLNNNVDIPAGVIVKNNQVSGYAQPSSSDGFGIVVEGTNHTVSGNTLTGNDVGIQQQAGHLPYPEDGNQSNLADQYFGRGNSPYSCGNTFSGNTYSGNGVDYRDVPGTLATQGTVINQRTSKIYCSIQDAVDEAQEGDEIKISSGTFSEDVTTALAAAEIKFSFGASPGCVTINGSLTLTSSNTLLFDIDGLTPCTQHDQLIVSGTVTLGGATLSIASTGYTPTIGDQVTIIDGSSSIAGQFAANTVTIGGQLFVIDYAGGDGNDVVLKACDGGIVNTNTGMVFCSIQEAIDNPLTLGGHVIKINVADFTEPGQILVTKSLTITGLGKNLTTLRSNINTGTNQAQDNSAWILTSPGTEVVIKDMTIDGTGKTTRVAVRFRDDGLVDNVAFNEIKSLPYNGTAVQIVNGEVDIKNSTFTNIGRIGAHFRNGLFPGAVISGSFTDNTYTGKGTGDWLDYAVDISGGTTVSVSNNTVSGNTGVASTDGSTSAGLLVTSYFPLPVNSDANNVTISGNTLTGNTTGLAVGYNAADVSVVVANNNKIDGNTWGVVSQGPSVNATNNYWGALSGPTYAGNPCGTGDEISDNVLYDCWWGNDALTQVVCQLIAYNVTGTSSICTGDDATITLSNSQNGNNYEYSLYRNNVLVNGSMKTGTGDALTWTVSPTANATYTVKAKNTLNACELDMNGSATIYIGPTLTAPEIVGCPGTIIEFPITVANFKQVGSVSLQMIYDKAVMTYNGYTTAYASHISSVNAIESGTPGRVLISGFNNTPLDLPDNTVLFTLKFNYIGGTTLLVFDDRGANEFDDTWCELGYGVPGPNYVPFCDGPGTHNNLYPNYADANYYMNGKVTETIKPIISATLTGPSGTQNMVSGGSYVETTCSDEDVTTSAPSSTSLDPSVCGQLRVQTVYTTTLSHLPPTQTFDLPYAQAALLPPTTISPQNFDGVAKEVVFVSTPYYDVDNSGSLTAGDLVGDPITFTLTVNPLPVITLVDLVTSIDQSSWNTVSGSLVAGYEMCVDPVIPYHYLDIITLAGLPYPLLSTAFSQNAFKLDVTSAPTGYFDYWDTKGVNGGATSGWQAVMWQIVNGNAPMFYISWDGSDYKLIDGLQYQIGQGANTLRITGDYPAGNYKFTGTVTDQNGCVSLPFDVKLKLNSAPVITCPDPITVSNDANQCGADVTFAATATGVPTPDITYNIAGEPISSGDFFPVGITTVVAVATNDCGTKTCTFTVTVNDNENPVFTDVPGDVTIQVNQSSNPGVTGFATATDNCDVTVTFSDVWAAGSCAGKGVITRTWKAQDPTGNSVTDVQIITIIDTQTPAITCPADIVVVNDPDECSAVVTFASPVSLDPGYFENWEAAGFVTGDYAGWAKYNSNLASVVSGSGGITSFAGDRHGLITPPASGFTGVFSRLGGYNSSFCNGYRVRLSVYMDLSDPAVTANTYGWDLSVASSNQAGGHLRDFVFHTASNAQGNILVGGSNNSNFARRNDLASINHHVISTSGWYIFEWEFRNQAGTLAVDLNLLDANGNHLWTETRTNAADLIATVVGGNRYMWFTFLATDKLAIDNASIERYTGMVSDYASGYAFPVGETIVTFTSTDCCNNTAQCSFKVTVNDTEEPVLTLPPDDLVLECYDAEAVQAWIATASATDNCTESPVITSSYTPPANSCPQFVEVEFTATDAANNSTTNKKSFELKRTTVPAEVGGPVATSSTVACPSQVIPPVNLPVVQDVCGVTLVDPTLTVSTLPTCEGEVTYTYVYEDCAGLKFTWIYTYTIEHTTAPVVPANPAPLVVQCEAQAIPSTPPPNIVDQCGVTVNPVGPFAGGTATSLYNVGFDEAVVTGPTQAAGVWYTDRYAPYGFVSPVLFNGDNRLKHSIDASDGASSRPGAYNSAFYNTQGRKYDLAAHTTYAEIELYIPADWATTGRRMAGFWGTAYNVNNAVSAYPIVEFTSDGGTARFRAWENTGWVDMGPVSTFNTWVKLSIELLPSGEFLCKAGSFSHTTTTMGADASARIGNLILQGHNTTEGVTYDIYWDNFAYQLCQGTKTFTWKYTDCAGLTSEWVETFNIDRTTAPAEFEGPVATSLTVSCPAAAEVPPAVLPVVKDVCGVTLPHPAPVVGSIPVCEGAVTYTYNYVDCAGWQFQWVYTYTIDYSGGLTAPTAGTSTVSCPASAVDPGAPANITDACGRTVSAVLVGYVDTPDPLVCEGTRVWTYRYTACDNTTTADWTYTYTIDNITPPTLVCPVVDLNGYDRDLACSWTGTGLAPVTLVDACGGVPTLYYKIGSGDWVLGNANGYLFPSGTTTVTYKAVDCAGNESTCSFDIFVKPITLSGNIRYHNPTGPVPLTVMNGTSVTLKQTGFPDMVTTADGNGDYSFSDICLGTWEVHLSTTKTAGGVNATDAAMVNFWGTGSNAYQIEKVNFYAGDVNASNRYEAVDALRIQSYFLNLGNPTWENRGLWTFWLRNDFISVNPVSASPGVLRPNITVSAGNVALTRDFWALSTGDFNGSWTPLTKSASETLMLNYGETITVDVGSAFELPLFAGMDMEVGAVSLILNIPADKLDVQSVTLTDNPTVPVAFEQYGSELRISWFSLTALNLAKGDRLITLHLTLKQALEEGELIYLSLAADPLNELANGSYSVIQNAELLVNTIKASAVGLPDMPASPKLTLANHPNPFLHTTRLSYSIPVSGDVTIDIYNLLGVKVKTLVNENLAAGDYVTVIDAGTWRPGVYTATIRLQSGELMLNSTIKIVRQQ